MPHEVGPRVARVACGVSRTGRPRKAAQFRLVDFTSRRVAVKKGEMAHLQVRGTIATVRITLIRSL